ncbi:MAG TPA: hypothetical protein VI160_05385, partial [Gemmatimonadales bacterium]
MKPPADSRAAGAAEAAARQRPLKRTGSARSRADAEPRVHSRRAFVGSALATGAAVVLPRWSRIRRPAAPADARVEV